MFTAACADQLAGLHGPLGKPCPARPWVCLLCPLAVFAPRHAANLLRLKAFFSRQWRQMPAAQFMAVFGPYAARIDEILDRFDPAELAAAAARGHRHRRRNPAAPRGDAPHDRRQLPPLPPPGRDHRSPAADVCAHAGLTLPTVRRPLFDEDLWDFTHVVGLPVEMPLADRRFDFAADHRPALAPGRQRTRLRSARPAPSRGRATAAGLPHTAALAQLLRPAGGSARLFAWLTARGVTTLTELDTRHCEAYLAFRRYLTDDDGAVVGEQGPAIRRAAAQIIVDLVDYRDLFTADRVRADLRPWGGATATSGRRNALRPRARTRPSRSPARCCSRCSPRHCTWWTILGPHAIELNEQIRETDRICSAERTRAAARRTHRGRRHRRSGGRLHSHRHPAAADRGPRRPTGGSPPGGRPTIPCCRSLPASWRGRPATRSSVSAGCPGCARCSAKPSPPSASRRCSPARRFRRTHRRRRQRTALDPAAAQIRGRRSGRDRAHRGDHRPGGLLGDARQRADGATCRLPPPDRGTGPGLTRFRLASKVIKGQPLGGTDDEWVVIEPAYRAVELARTAPRRPARRGTAVRPVRFHRSATAGSATGSTPRPEQRLGLGRDPGRAGDLRMLRQNAGAGNGLPARRRPGRQDPPETHRRRHHRGLRLAAGGAQAELLAEVNKHESRPQPRARPGRVPQLPAGHPARRPRRPQPHRVLRQHRHRARHATSATAPKIQRNDRDILNLLSKRAKILHLGTGELLLVHRPFPRALPQARRHPDRRPAAGRDV